MGKQVSIKPDYSTVLLPDGQPHNAGGVVVLTDAEYAALDPATVAAVTLLGTVAEPVRPSQPDASGNPQLRFDTDGAIYFL